MNTAADPGQRNRRRQQDKAVDGVFEVNLINGAEAERLGLQQAAVIRDVLRWCRRDSNSAPPDTSVT